MLIEQTHPSVLQVSFDRTKTTGQKFLFISDVHFDNPNCDRELFKKHMDQAVSENAQVVCFGDFFCAMGGKKDPRMSKGEIRPEYNKSNYYDCIVNDAVEWLTPYKDNILAFTEGNHETAVRKNMETDLLDRLIGGLGGGIKKLGYIGYVIIRTHFKESKVRTKRIFFHHGHWGGVVTKGTLSVMRYAAISNGADIIVSGHVHDAWSVPHAYYDVDHFGRLKIREVDVLKCGTYKEEFESGSGWATERIVVPKIKRQWWLDVEWNTTKVWHGIREAR